MISLEFLLAGRAVFTVSNDKGEHYTYKLLLSDDSKRYFLYLRTGEEFVYMGMLVGDNGNLVAIPTKASKFPKDTKPFKVFNWVYGIVKGLKSLPAGYDIQHEGQCAKCGRPLTNPESIKSGFGPVCAGLEK